MLVFAPGADAARKQPPKVVSSKALKAKVSTGQWSFALTDRKGKRVLREAPGTGTAAIGRLGFSVDGQWKRATRVVKSWRRGRTAMRIVRTTDPARNLRVEVQPAGAGSIRLRATVLGPDTGLERLGMSFNGSRSERYLGFGERSNAVDFRGQEVENWVAEGPYQKSEYPVIKSFVPEWALRTREDATYFPVPWLLSTDGYGVLVENSEPSYFRLGTERRNAWSVELSRTVDGLAAQPESRPSPRTISLRFFAGPDPADSLRRMTAATGRQPDPAPWYFGPWVQSKNGDKNTIDSLKAADSPTSVGQTYTHYLPCGPGNRENEVNRSQLFHGAGMAVTTYFNPMICLSYGPYSGLASSGQLTETTAGLPYTYKYLSYEVGQFDFLNPAARDSYGELLREALDDGHDGWMEDFGEYTPPDSISHDGTPGMVSHNRYPTDYHCAAHEQTKDYGRPALRYVRSGFTGTAACAPVVWGGDPSTEWDYDGLRDSIRNGLSMGLSGVGIWGSDIGGFFSLLSPPLSDELLARWVQFGAFSGVMRSQADGLQGGDRVRPQILDPGQIDNWRRHAKIRTQLYPYISGAASEYRRNGMPIMRALALGYPDDRKALAIDDQYMFGDGLMVAPVIEPGKTTEDVYLPKGLWVDLWRSVSYNKTDGSLSLNRSKLLRGNGTRQVPAPADEIPVLAKAGTLLTLLPSDVDTLAPYGTEDPEITHLEDRNSVRRLMAFPRGTSRATFEESGALVSRDTSKARGGKRQWKLTVKDVRTRTWEVQATLKTLRKPFTPRCVKLNGKKLAPSAWSYSRKDRKLAIDVKAPRRKSTLVVRPGRC